MYTTDLWLALLDKDNPRGHPLLAALLYAFCPTAARWWLAGADPAHLPFDPVWQAMKDLSGGETLKAALMRYGFEDILDEAKRYVDEVDAYRRTHPGIDAPETLPTFPGGRMSLDRRFGLSDAIANLGKDWSNFFAYIRAWAFLCPDWEARIQFFAAPELGHVRLALTLPGIRRPAYLPAWLWTLKQGYAIRLVIGLLIENEQDEIRFSLAACSPAYLPAPDKDKEAGEENVTVRPHATRRFADAANTGGTPAVSPSRSTPGAKGTGRRAGSLGPNGVQDGKVESKPFVPQGRKWLVTPEVWALNRHSGIAEPRDPRIDDEHLPALVNTLTNAAEKGPHPPLVALRCPSACRKCGYQSLCFQEDHCLTPLAASMSLIPSEMTR